MTHDDKLKAAIKLKEQAVVADVIHSLAICYQYAKHEGDSDYFKSRIRQLNESFIVTRG